MLEHLESRRLLSAANLTSKGTLQITGTVNADTLAVGLNSSGSVVLVDAQTSAGSESLRYTRTLIKRISIDAGAGADTIDVSNAPSKRATLLGGKGDDKLIGGKVATVLSGGDGNDTLFGSSAVDLFVGGKGQDLVVDQVLTREMITGKASETVKSNLGTRASGLEGYDIADQPDRVPEDDDDTPEQNATPPVFQNPTNENPGNGSIFDNPGGGSIFDSPSGGVGGLFA